MLRKKLLQAIKEDADPAKKKKALLELKRSANNDKIPMQIQKTIDTGHNIPGATTNEDIAAIKAVGKTTKNIVLKADTSTLRSEDAPAKGDRARFDRAMGIRRPADKARLYSDSEISSEAEVKKEAKGPVKNILSTYEADDHT